MRVPGAAKLPMSGRSYCDLFADRNARLSTRLRRRKPWNYTPLSNVPEPVMESSESNCPVTPFTRTLLTRGGAGASCRIDCAGTMLVPIQPSNLFWVVGVV